MKGKMTMVLLTAIAVGCSAPDRDSDAYASGSEASRNEVRGSDELVDKIASAPSEGIHEAASTTSTAAQVAHTAATQQQQTARPGTSASGGGSTATASDPAATPEEKKKMSNTTKGILIGAGAGIITGAAVSKEDRAKGAVIGGVIGAATGGATGAVIDHRKKKQ
jgi:hypothetical protein